MMKKRVAESKQYENQRQKYASFAFSSSPLSRLLLGKKY